MGDIPFPSKPINRISYDGRTNNSYQTLLQREGPYTTNPIQLNQYSQSHRFCGPGYVNRYRRVPQTGQFYPYELESSSFPYPLPASCSSSLLSEPTDGLLPSINESHSYQSLPYTYSVYHSPSNPTSHGYNILPPILSPKENSNAPQQANLDSNSKKTTVPKEKKSVAKYIIDINKVCAGTEKRHTVMLKNIPNSFTQDYLITILDSCVPNCYDFVYVPVDFHTNCNLGFGYVSLINSGSLIKLYNFMHMKRWPNTSSNKTCEVVFARIQGDRDMRRICKDWSVMQLPEQYHPIFYKKEVVTVNGVKHVTLKRVKCEGK